MPLTIPRNLAQSIDEQTDGDRRPWLAGLDRLVADLAQRWALEVAQPFEPGGMLSWVAPARTTAGDDVVLKVSWRSPEGEHEADGLAVWAGDGTVRLLDTHRTEDSEAFLLERCRPGTWLRDVLEEPQQDVVVARLLRRLWVEPAPGHPFRPLLQMCDDWADAFEGRLAERGASRLDPGLAREGIALWRRLPREETQQVLLATDLHAGNVLAADREPWLVIDPKPYLGDPHYDPLQHMFNCEQRLLTDPVGLAHRMADLLDLDADRLVQWLFARSVVEHEWWTAFTGLPALLAP